jgi:amidase
MDDLVKYDALGLAELVRKGEVTPLELVESTIQRIEEVNPRINAVICRMYDQARAGAQAAARTSARLSDAPFGGVPFLMKDLFADYEGAPLSEGSRAVEGHISKMDSELVRRHKASGLITIGKTNTPEFGITTTTEPRLHGPTRNPWDPGLTPGGSSGGSAAAVAAGIVPMAHGNDGGGSIRIPASCCGVFGMKPARGRNPLGPLFGDIGGGIAHEHGLTRTVRDSAALLDATSGPDLGDPYCAPPAVRPFLEETRTAPGRLKIGFLTRVPDGWNEETELHTDCLDAVKDAARLCEDLGHAVEEVKPATLSFPDLPGPFFKVFSCYVGHAFAYWNRVLGKTIRQDEVEPGTWDVYQGSLRTTGGEYLAAWEYLQLFSRKVARWYHEGRYDALLTPTMRIPPTRLGAFDSTPENPSGWISIALSFVAFTRTANITGQPAMSVPLFWNKHDVPIGVQFAGRTGDEATLFRLAAQLEEARPWAGRLPRIHCER